MTDVISAAFLLIGSLFLLLAALGVLRMPDLFMRIQVATKASTLGVGCILLAFAVYFHDVGMTMRALLVISFFLMTAPVAAHMLGRAAYLRGVPLWEATSVDELQGQYDRQTRMLQSTPPGPAATPGDASGQAGPRPAEGAS
ncbi:MAG: monovalent cation/H(+) antiporter subunit G [Candidatus Tectimicrobiota bacterium]